MLSDTQCFEPFVSDLLRQSLMRCGQQFDSAFEELVPAALLFGDLSGFTEVAERLAADHSRGSEEAQRILNQHFCRVLAVIEHWQGTLLSFAGDATIAVWPAGAQGLAAATLRATTCALDIQAHIGRAQNADRSVMPHRVVIGAGSLWLAHVGGHEGKWEFMVGGRPWDQIRAADKFAGPGRVVVSPQAWSELSRHARGTLVGAGCYHVTQCNAEANPEHVTEPVLSASSGEACARYLSGAFKAQMIAGQRDWLAEYRWVTVLYLTIEGIEQNPTRALAQLHAAARSVQQVVRVYDGHLVQFMVDDKGLVALMAWGLALSSHEDDAERALRVACALSQDLSALGLSSRAGVKTGRVFAGLLGHDRHLEYAIIGDPVNSASRIAGMSEGEPLCDLATRDAAQQRFVLELARTVRLKGKGEPVDVYRVVSERPRRESVRPHANGARSQVDRELERATIDIKLAAVCAGAGAFVHVIGEPGVGKSTLVEFLAGQARQLGLTCAIGAGDNLRRKEAYVPWSTVLPALLGTQELTSVEKVCRALSVLGVREELAPLLSSLLQHVVPETANTESLDSAGRADLTRELVAEIVIASQRRARILLILDDAHWFDSPSWSLLLTLLRRVPDLALVLLSRPLDDALLSADARRILELPARETLELGPLSFAASRTLVATRLAVESISDDLAQRVFERAEGNPLFTEELLLSLEQQEAIRRAERSATLARDSKRALRMVLPDGIDGVVASRIASLDAAQQLTIKVASVLGRSFRLHALAALRPIPLSQAELSEQLESMCASQLLERPLGADADEYRFHHSIIQNVVHELLVSEQQRQLHRSAAEMLEREETDNRTRTCALLAHHWGLADNDRKAIDYLELAAQQARQDHAMFEVTGFLSEAFQRALRCPEAVPPYRRARWEHLLGEAEVELGLLAQAEQHLARAVNYLDGSQPRSDLALALALAREFGVHVLFRTTGLGRPPVDRDRALSAARVYSALAAIYYNNHEFGRMLYATLAGANLALRAQGDSPILARMLATLSIVAAFMPLADSDYYAREALQMAERLSDAFTLQEVLFVIANYEMGVARFAPAIEHCDRAVQIARAAGEIRNLEMSLGTLANLYRLRGEFARGELVDRQVLQSGFDRSVAQTQVWGYFGRACALAHLNRFDELGSLLVGFESLLTDPEVVRQVSASNIVAQLLTSALLHLHHGREEPAREALRKSIQLLDSLDHLQAYMTCTLSYLHGALMGCWRRRPRCRELRNWSAQADRFAERCARIFPCAVPQAMIGRGNRALRQGRARRAARAFEGALEAARRIENPFDQACAHHSLSLCTALRAAEREFHAEHCRGHLERLGLAPPFAWTV